MGKKSLHTNHVAPESAKERNRLKKLFSPRDEAYYYTADIGKIVELCSCGNSFVKPKKGVSRKIERTKCEKCREVVFKMEDLCE